MACVDRRPALGDVTAHTGRNTCASMALVTRMVAALSAQSLHTSAISSSLYRDSHPAIGARRGARAPRCSYGLIAQLLTTWLVWLARCALTSIEFHALLRYVTETNVLTCVRMRRPTQLFRAQSAKRRLAIHCHTVGAARHEEMSCRHSTRGQRAVSQCCCCWFGKAVFAFNTPLTACAPAICTSTTPS